MRVLCSHSALFIAIIMGTITGAAGGVLRDILINEVPLIFRKEIYAMACVFGGIVYWICYRLDYAPHLTQVLAALTVIATRIVAVKYKLSLPRLRGDEEVEESENSDREDSRQ